MDFLQHWSMRPQLFRIRFARWQDVLAVPQPTADRPHALAMWHYARGRALAAMGETAAAREQLEALRSILGQGDGGPLAGLRMEFNPSVDLVSVAERVLTGRLAAAEGDEDVAVAALREAVELEDRLLYGEPPEWSVPARQDLAEVLLEAGRAAEADAVFLQDLDRFPANVWSLRGRVRALRALGREQEASEVLAELQQVWEGAGPPLGPVGGGEATRKR
jgi:tetratricopeptide (TPR) repeat protein